MYRKLQTKELDWLKKMLEVNFLGKTELLEQIQNAYVTPHYCNNFISLKFHVGVGTDIFPYKVRNPVEMRAYQEDSVPVVCLIHILNGYLDELEVFNADSSKISDDFSLENVELVINPDLALGSQ